MVNDSTPLHGKLRPEEREHGKPTSQFAPAKSADADLMNDGALAALVEAVRAYVAHIDGYDAAQEVPDDQWPEAMMAYHQQHDDNVRAVRDALAALDEAEATG